MKYSHLPVLYDEALEAMNLSLGHICLDATFGRGGHSAGILEALGDDGRLLALDKDLQAIETAEQKFAADERFQIRQASFADIDEILQDDSLDELANKGFDAVLMDLGVSSPQLDDPRRGFSFKADGPLDMRMDTSRGERASEWLKRTSEPELKRVLKEFGEERFAGRVASAIVKAAGAGELKTTAELAKVVRAAIPFRDGDKDSATRSFQAIRIAVNRELDDLGLALDRMAKLLNCKGRLVVISFHSLEDRMVKQAFKRLSSPAQLPRKLPVAASSSQPDFRIVGKPVKASAEELSRNPRARSAVMRVLEKQA